MPTPSIAERLIAEVIRLFPAYLAQQTKPYHQSGDAAVCVISPDGAVGGHIFGGDKARGRHCFGLATRKVMQVWATGYATGRFEELVYSGRLSEEPFGINRPDFIGWFGGVPLLLDDGTQIAAAFSGLDGASDVAIIEKAAESIPGLRVKRD